MGYEKMKPNQWISPVMVKMTLTWTKIKSSSKKRRRRIRRKKKLSVFTGRWRRPILLICPSQVSQFHTLLFSLFLNLPRRKSPPFFHLGLLQFGICRFNFVEKQREKCRRRHATKEWLLMVVVMLSIMSMALSSKFLESMFLLFVLSVEALLASYGEHMKNLSFLLVFHRKSEIFFLLSWLLCFPILITSCYLFFYLLHEIYNLVGLFLKYQRYLSIFLCEAVFG